MEMSLIHTNRHTSQNNPSTSLLDQFVDLIIITILFIFCKSQFARNLLRPFAYYCSLRSEGPKPFRFKCMGYFRGREFKASHDNIRDTNEKLRNQEAFLVILERSTWQKINDASQTPRLTMHHKFYKFAICYHEYPSG